VANATRNAKKEPLKMPPLVRLLAKRLGTSLIVLVGVSILIFAIARVIPGDPARIALGPNATADAVAALRERLHLNESVVAQYGYFVSDLAQGDLGVSLYTNRPVTTDIAEFLPATMELIIISGLMMVLLGVPLGILSARYRGTWVDHTARFVTLLGVSAPGFVWAVILMLLFSYFTHFFPIAGRISDNFAITPVTGFMLADTLISGNLAAFADAIWHIILPAFALALSGIGQAARLVRSNMVETYDKPYIEMAEAYGFPERKIARKYAFRPSMIPSLTIIGLDFASMLGNAFLVESVYAWPGLSKYGVQVILRKDLNAIVGTVLIISAMFLIVNIVVDLMVSIINPRIRLSQRAS
jgi:peptide/nickel transport system permease protein